LAAVEKGLALEWIFPRDEATFTSQLTLDKTYRLVALGFLGYPADAEELPDIAGRGVFRNEFRP